MRVADLERWIAPLRQRVSTMVLRCVTRGVNDKLKWQELQVEGLQGQLLDGIEVLHPYGLTARAHIGAEGLILAVGGNGNHYVCLPVGDRRHRPTDIGAGEVMVHADQEGLHIHLKAGGEMEVSAPQKLVLKSGGTSIELTPEGIVGRAAQYDWRQA